MEGSQQQYPVLPPHTVAKAVVVFVQGVPFADLEQQHSEGLDRLAQLGCSGRLFPRLLPRDELGELLQILGIYGSLYDAEGKGPFLKDDVSFASLYKKFGSLKLGLLSNDPEVVALGESLRVPVVVHLQSGGDVEETTRQLAAAQEQVDLAFVHVKATADFPALALADQLVARLLTTKENKKPLVSVIAGHSSPASDEPKPNSKLYYPVQSAAVIDGKTSPLLPAGHLATYYHEGSTRRDDVQRFTEAEVKSKGANGNIAAEQFVAELAFKLGKTPKYGA